jgi:hypothetical protein
VTTKRYKTEGIYHRSKTKIIGENDENKQHTANMTKE